MPKYKERGRPVPVCTPKSLTPKQYELALRRSLEINPDNAAESATVMRTPAGRRGGPRRLALVVGRRWPVSGVQLTVQFLDNPPKDLRLRILLHMNAWNKTANVNFVETCGTGMVRIARLDSPADIAGYWSYVGTEILGIEEGQPTINLDSFTMRTSEAEFRRVVRHETGHTLGFDHEHMRAALVQKIDRRKAIAYYDRTEGWTAEETIAQVLTPLSSRSIMGTTESDPLSIMCYQIPAAITKDGKAILGGRDINERDYEFAGKVYPKKGRERADGADVETIEPRPKPAPQAAASLAVSRPSQPDSEFHIIIMDEFSPQLQGYRPPSGSPVPSSHARQHRFARVLASYGGARVTSAMRLSAGKEEEPTRFGKIIRIHERIKEYTDRERGSLPPDDQMVAFGTDLFETLFQGDVRRLYDEARARQHQRKLDFVLTSMIPWIAEKPWEFAYDSVRKSFLATEEIHFIRNVLTAVPADVIPQRPGPLRILVAAAQPVGFGRLSVEQEEDVINRGFERLIAEGLAEVKVLPRATPGNLHEMLKSCHFNVVHFIGHGTYDENAREGKLIFEDGRGGQLRLGSRSVHELLCGRGISLVFLNACQTGRGGKVEFNKGVAQSLVSHGLPALVANQYSVLDSSATSFAQHFYWALAQGESIGEAARDARIAVNYSMQGEIIDWAVPVVYARDPNMALSEGPDKGAAASAVSRRRPTSSAGMDGTTRVAVWDIDSVFPALGKTLLKMNDAQSVFHFQLVDMSAPIDVWDLTNRADDGTPYLWAEKLAHRLESATVELRVDILACVTRHWMRDDNYVDIYGWWPDGAKPPVLVFSCAGFDELPVEGLETDRAFANVTVSALAGFLGDMGSHERGAKDCPMAFNRLRDYGLMVGRQKFDRSCYGKLRKRIPGELAAFDALLKAFHSRGSKKRRVSNYDKGR